MIPRDTYRSIPQPASLDQVPLDRWKELSADGVLIGSVAKTPKGVLVSMRLINVASGASAMAQEYSGSATSIQANPVRALCAHHRRRGPQGAARTERHRPHQDRLLVRPRRRAHPRPGGRSRHLEHLHGGLRRRAAAARDDLQVARHLAGLVARRHVRSRSRRGAPASRTSTSSTRMAGPSCRTRPRATPSKQNYLPAWSPDGSKLAFTSNRDGNAEIYVMNRDGSGVRRLTNHPTIDVTPTWSPTGTQIAFTSDRTGTPQIYIMNADGTRAAADHQRVVVRSADLVAGAAQRDRLLLALRRRQHHQGLRFRDAQHARADRRHRQQREPGVLAERPPRRVRVDARRQGADLHDPPRRHGTAADHQDGNEPLSALVEIARPTNAKERFIRDDDAQTASPLHDGVDARGGRRLQEDGAARRPADAAARRDPGGPTRTARPRRRRRSRSRGRCRPSRSPRIRSRRATSATSTRTRRSSRCSSPSTAPRSTRRGSRR